MFKTQNKKHSNQHLFSTLIRCKECGWSFRRTVRTYKNTYVKWVCSGRNGKGADSCPNAVTIDEDELIEVIENYFSDILSHKKNVISKIVDEFKRIYKAKDDNTLKEKELRQELNKLNRNRQKYIDMYTDELITREELKAKIGKDKREIERLQSELKLVEQNLTKGDKLEIILNDTFKKIGDVCNLRNVNNTQLKKVIDRIDVDHDGNVEIHLKLLKEIGLDETVLIHNACT